MHNFVTTNPSNNAETCILRYTTSDNKMLYLSPYDFGAEKIVSHTYNNGEGQVIFNTPIRMISKFASSNCSLTSINIPDDVTEIWAYAFSNFKHLRSITIPNSVIEIENSAFGGCDSLRSITIPNSVTKIGRGAFAYCKSLSAFYGKFASADNRCLIVDGVLNSFALAGLTEYTIPNSVTKIGDRAFCYCKSLTSVTIPNSVTEIGDRAFIGCSSLQTIICKPTTPPILGLGAFHDVHSNATIIFPEGCKEAYMSSDWRRALL